MKKVRPFCDLVRSEFKHTNNIKIGDLLNKHSLARQLVGPEGNGRGEGGSRGGGENRGRARRREKVAAGDVGRGMRFYMHMYMHMCMYMCI